MKRTKPMTYGSRDVLSPKDFANPKVRISILLDEEVIKRLTQHAESRGTTYQALIARILTKAVGIKVANKAKK